jgi:S-adenosylmethionine:tRNA-ribosyltransferase-isomerase (queuine synthetase)
MNIQVRQEKRIEIKNNKIALSSAQQGQHRTESKQKFMTDVNIFLNPSYRMRKHNIIASSFHQLPMLS